jgi:hypothetical protein
LTAAYSLVYCKQLERRCKLERGYAPECPKMNDGLAPTLAPIELAAGCFAESAATPGNSASSSFATVHDLHLHRSTA